MKYLIHACNKRLWYVDNYLIPSMIEQDINRKDIDVYLDKNNEGCLESCMKAFLSVPNDAESTWHLQDDVIICSDFKQRTEELYNEGIVCGYCYDKDDRKNVVGNCKPKEMWFSFPCIKIPNKIAKKCANWYFNKVKQDNAYGVYVRSKKHDDTLFYIFMEDYYPDMNVLNLMPNLADHVDYLLGGSVVNYMRLEKETHATYFEDAYLIEELEQKLKKELMNLEEVF